MSKKWEEWKMYDKRDAELLFQNTRIILADIVICEDRMISVNDKEKHYEQRLLQDYAFDLL